MQSNQRAIVGTLAVLVATAVTVLVLSPPSIGLPCVAADFVDVKATALDPTSKVGNVSLSADPVSFGGKTVGVKWSLVNGVNPRIQLSFTRSGIEVVNGTLKSSAKGHRLSDTEYLVCFNGQQPAQAQGDYHIEFVSSLDGQATTWTCDPTIINDHMRGDGGVTNKRCAAR